MNTSQIPRRDAGFVMPIVLFALVLMSTVAVSALLVSSDEHKASQAMRLSSLSFYTAEGGMNQVFATWDSYTDDIGALAPGDSFDLGWQTLANGASYRAVIHRWDNDGDQPLYRLTTTGKGEGPFMGSRTLAVSLTLTPGEPGSGYMLGECCDGPAVLRGDADVKDGSVIDGHDQHPPGWGDADVCADSLYDRPGMIMQDTSLLNLKDDGSAITGEPPIVQDPTMSDDDFFQFGPDLTWDDLKDMADHVIGEEGDNMTLDGGDVYPRYNADGTCDTSHPYNWGSNDPNDPCFNYFPIIVTKGDLNTNNLYGQAIIILDYYTTTDSLGNPLNIGSELDLEDNTVFNGIILGKGCLEIQRDAVMHGAAYIDGTYENDLCGSDDTLDLNDPGFLNWSQCAVDRAMLNSGLKDFAEPKWPGETGGVKMLKGRSFMEMY